MRPARAGCHDGIRARVRPPRLPGFRPIRVATLPELLGRVWIASSQPHYLLLAVRPDLFGNIAGSTDSELLFHLALTFGLTDDPVTGIARMAGFVEAAAAAAGVGEPALQMTIGISDGVRLYAVRYASGPKANTLFVSGDRESVRMLYPDDERLTHFGDDARVVVSEPLTRLPGVWREVHAGTALVIGEDIEERPFQPIE
jgi:predicted glutamine amidotransferase